MALRIFTWMVLIGISLTTLPYTVLGDAWQSGIEFSEKSNQEEKTEIEKEESKVLTSSSLLTMKLVDAISGQEHRCDVIDSIFMVEPPTQPPELA